MAATNSTSKTLQTMEDLPGRNHFANVGFMWPADHTNVVLQSANAAKEVCSFTWRDAAELRIYVSVMWRFDPPGTTPSVAVPLKNLSQ
jgi:hypothetical protein